MGGEGRGGKHGTGPAMSFLEEVRMGPRIPVPHVDMRREPLKAESDLCSKLDRP